MRIFRRNRKLFKILFLLFIPIALYAAIKLTLWYSAKTTIEKIVQQSAGFFELKYQTISSSLKGNVSVNGITIFIPLFKESIQIKRVQLSADNVISLLRLRSKFESKDIPKSLGLYVEGVTIDLDSKVFEISPQIEQTPSERINALACGEIKRFDGSALKAMGYTEITANFNINYQYNPLLGTLELNLDETIDQFFSINLTALIHDLQQIPDTAGLAMGMSNPQSLPKVGKVSLSIEDDSFISRKVNFCAKNNNSTAQDYIDKHVALVDNYLQQIGVKLHQSLLASYKKSLQFPGNVVLSMDFSDSPNFMELSNFLLDDIIVQLGTELLVNNDPISPISIQFNENKFLNSLGENQKEIKVDDPNVKVKVEKKYRLVNRNQLDRYIKYPVIIKTNKGKTYTGSLSKDSQFSYEIIARTRGGNIGYFVKKDDIKSAQVYY